MEFMSQEGYDKLVAELHNLIEVELPRAIDAVSEARDKGDLSENYEYRAAKRAHSRLLGLIHFKQNVLTHARVLKADQVHTDSVQLLSRVDLFNMAQSRTMTFTIVNPHEANIKEGKISIKSPIAQALMGHRLGDIVKVRVPAGLLELRIDKIEIGG
jgi:transcription elongation factor GreA